MGKIVYMYLHIIDLTNKNHAYMQSDCISNGYQFPRGRYTGIVEFPDSVDPVPDIALLGHTVQNEEELD